MTLPLLVLYSPIVGQALHNSGGSIYVQSGATLTIVGNFRNSTSGSDGSIDNDGTITFTGDWDNDATGGVVFTSLDATGTVSAIGSSTQDIGGTRTTTFENLTINNTAAGGVTLSQDITVEETLTLTDGVVTTGSNMVSCTSNAATDITGYSDASFINGNLRKAINNGGANTDTYPLPVGDGTTTSDYHLAEFINNNITGTTALDVSVAAITEGGSNIDANLSTSQDGTPITDVVADAQWTIDQVGAITGGSYGVNLYLTNLSSVTGADDNMICPVKRSSSSTTYADWDTFDGSTTIPANGAAGRTSASGYVQRTGLTSFSFFAVAKGMFVLPIELLTFSATLNNDIVDLTWITASEIGNDYFTIERTIDGNHFDSILSVDGSGYSNTHITYNELDENPLMGTSYYRLKQTDYNGNFTYSDLVPVTGRKQVRTEIWGHNNLIYLSTYGIEHLTNIDISLLNSSGQEIFAKQLSLEENTNKLDLGFSEHVSAGVYFGRIRIGDTSKIQKIVLQ